MIDKQERAHLRGLGVASKTVRPSPATSERSDAIDTAILIPVFNDPQGLERTLRSIDEPIPYPVIVVDDGSSEPIVVRDDLGLDLCIIRLSENLGIEHALNEGLNHLRRILGVHFVARLDAGDLARPGRFTRQRLVFHKSPGLVLLGALADFFDPDSGEVCFRRELPLTDEAIRRGMYRNNMVLHSAAMFRLDAALAVGGYPLGFPAKEDHEFFWRLLELGEVRNMPSVELDVEFAPGGISRSRRRRQILSGIRTISRRWTDNPMRASYGILFNVALLLTPTSVLNRLKLHRGKGQQLDSTGHIPR